jgi:hypothetical protein
MSQLGLVFAMLGAVGLPALVVGLWMMAAQ